MTSEQLQAKREALIAEIASATQSVQSGDRSVTKRSVADLERALALINSELERASSSDSSPVIGYIYSREGL